MSVKLLTEHHLEFLGLKLVCNYTCQNATLFEIQMSRLNFGEYVIEFMQ